jgi:hypothetical protein
MSPLQRPSAGGEGRLLYRFFAMKGYIQLAPECFVSAVLQIGRACQAHQRVERCGVPQLCSNRSVSASSARAAQAAAARACLQQPRRALAMFRGSNASMQQRHAFVGILRGRRCHIVQFRIERDGMPLVLATAAAERDRHIQCDAVHPGRKRARGVGSRKRTPQLRGNLLRQVGAIVRIRQ